MRIREDVTWQAEKRQRELLQDHIGALTNLVNKTDRDIKVSLSCFTHSVESRAKLINILDFLYLNHVCVCIIRIHMATVSNQ